ncbi:hypothetical protein [Nitrosospira multiformis]|uniref:Uncharacterized protein n=1 Tax=Nitrosospira multiformis TaxID=1231 RepID=A0A1I7FTG9_9PROT|nr:hypothetical protein [Nitrosospira multiformis]SFU39463.1 hypothetical protein SAMN05216417_102202 [Nitrosospira multiformis]
MVEPTDAKLRISGGLTNTFLHCRTCLPDEDFDRLRRMESTERENHIHNGQLSGSVTSVIERNSAANTSQSTQAEERKSKERRTAQFVELLEQIRTSIKQMETDVKALIASFEKRDGDAWREKLALDILGADDIPQQRSGENINAYRKRLEQHLINEMLNADGTIKDKYKNDAKYGDYADWAQKQFHLNSARAIVAELDDDNTGPQRKEQLFDEMKERGFIQEMVFADRVSNSVDTKASVRDGCDSQHDEMLSQASSSNATLKFLS